MRSSHTAFHNDDAPAQSEQERSQFENAVLKAYGIVAVHECSASFQGKPVADLRSSQGRWKKRESSLDLSNETTSSKGTKDVSMNDIMTRTPFAVGQPWQIARAAAEVRTKNFEEDVLKAYGLLSTRV